MTANSTIASLAQGEACDRRWGSTDETLEWAGPGMAAIGFHDEAQRLLEKAGSPERAKAAIDAMLAETWVEECPTREDEFARAWGFRTFLAMRMSSAPVAGEGKKNWRATALHDGRLILWDEKQLVAIESPCPARSLGS